MRGAQGLATLERSVLYTLTPLHLVLSSAEGVMFSLAEKSFLSPPNKGELLFKLNVTEKVSLGY